MMPVSTVTTSAVTVRKIAKTKAAWVAVLGGRLEFRKPRMEPAHVVGLDCRGGKTVMPKL